MNLVIHPDGLEHMGFPLDIQLVELGDARADMQLEGLAHIPETPRLTALALRPGLGDGPHDVIDFATVPQPQEERVQLGMHMHPRGFRQLNALVAGDVRDIARCVASEDLDGRLG